ncbi:MAG: DegQ family serine endoprotease [Desulfuromonadales bacterium]|nr:DegQ family serine endoprotease [Desulfuromonadales bacterium]MBN2792226.1 DegQ family serine endoprotease [Desulfuromonadales bacterium]
MNFKWLSTLLLAMFLVQGTAYAQQEQGLRNLKETGQAFRSVAQKVSPAVVFIKVEKEIKNGNPEEFSFPFDDDFFRRFFGTPPQGRQPRNNNPQKRHEVGQGSGFLISADGYILTNNHVVGDADKVQVQMLDGREYDAEIIGTDPASDLAVIKIDETKLPYLSLGDSDKLQVGDWVLAFGNPFGLSHTLTAGIVSAKGRSGIGLNDYEDFIQTDAAINPGNSGGPLVNLDGEVVGINSAIFSRSGGYMGIGFAIPVNMAKQVKTQLIEHGEVKRGRLGVHIQNLTADLAESFGLDQPQGVLVTQVEDDSPAQEAGLKQGDVILMINHEKTADVGALRNRVALIKPGTKVELTVLRDGKTKILHAIIGQLENAKVRSEGGSLNVPMFGLSLQNLSPELAERFGYQGEQGVLVAEVESGSAAAQAGFKRGSLILEIDRQQVQSVEQAKKLLADKKPVHLFLLKQGEVTQYVALKVEK